MMPRSPTFLSRLAPSAATSPFAVRAALPARYAPIGAALPIHEQVEIVADPERRRADTPVPARAVRADAAAAAVPEGAGNAGTAVATETPPFAAERPNAAAPTVELKHPVNSEVRPAAAAAEAAMHRPHPAPPDTLESPPTFQVKPAPEPSGPLKSGTVMERALAAHRTEPDIVQVTIDRIDIRMPPEAGHAAGRAEPRKRAAPTISLSDYLRGANSTPRSRG
jgi:hypothetical protein